MDQTQLTFLLTVRNGLFDRMFDNRAEAGETGTPQVEFDLVG